MNTTRITLAKALKLKNRFVSRICRLQSDIQEYNSVQEGQERPDVNQLMSLLDNTVDNLVNLKYAIYVANSKVQKTIFDLAERKSRLCWLSHVSTRNGQFSDYAEPVTYSAVITKTEADTMRAKLEQDIDALQESLDKFNHSTEIEVPSEFLESFPVVGTASATTRKRK